MRGAQPWLIGYRGYIDYLTLAFVVIAGAALLCSGGCSSLPEAGGPHTPAVSGQPAHAGDMRGTQQPARDQASMVRLSAKVDLSEQMVRHLHYEQAVNADSPLVFGNRLTLLQNGPQTYRAMLAAIDAATDHINFQTFIFADDDIGRRFSDRLLARQAAGVQVNVIYDSVGGLTTPQSFFDRLRDGGVRVLEFNPVSPVAEHKKGWNLNHRDHRKLMVVDGATAFVGGINISETYSSLPAGRSAAIQDDDTETETGSWRDTHLQIDGPVVAEFQKLFLDTWTRQNGEALARRAYFPALAPMGDEIVRAIGSTPDDGHSLIYQTLISVIDHAEDSVHLTIAYFAPDAQLRKSLIDAAQRGVEVRLILPSRMDSDTMFHLSRSYYGQLLRGGVQIFERQGAVMHAKTALIDGVWSTIGSTNLDWRSFLYNDEINAVIVGHAFGRQMEDMFTADLAESEQITRKAWRQRPLRMWIQERLARIGAYWL